MTKAVKVGDKLSFLNVHKSPSRKTSLKVAGIKKTKNGRKQAYACTADGKRVFQFVSSNSGTTKYKSCVKRKSKRKSTSRKKSTKKRRCSRS